MSDGSESKNKAEADEQWYVLHWELLGGHRGHGAPMSEVSAAAWRDSMQEKHPDDLYWIEPVGELIS